MISVDRSVVTERAPNRGAPDSAGFFVPCVARDKRQSRPASFLSLAARGALLVSTLRSYTCL